MGNFRHRHKNFHVPSFPRAILHNHLPWSSFLHTLILRCYQELTPFGIFKCVRYSCNIFGVLSTNAPPPHTKKNGQKCSCSRIFYLFYVGNSIRHFFVDRFFKCYKCCKPLFRTTCLANCCSGQQFCKLSFRRVFFANCRCESFFLQNLQIVVPLIIFLYHVFHF